MWTLIGRVAMNIFQKEDSQFFFMRVFVKFTNPLLKVFKPLLPIGILGALPFSQQIMNFLKSPFGKRAVSESVEQTAKAGTKTGIRSRLIIGDNVVAKVSIGVMTSEFSGISNISNANKFADEPEFTIIPNCFPNNFATSLSNFFTFSPRIVL